MGELGMTVLAVDVADLVDRWRDLGAELWVAAGAITAVWFLVFGALAVATNPGRVEAGPETLELGGPEPPAVVNLLTRDWRLGREALPATLLDLAARRHLAVDQVGDETLVRTRAPRAATTAMTPTTLSGGDSDLAPYEQMVLDHVRSLAGHADDGVVPAAALTTGPDQRAKRWWRRFHHAVHDDARARGLAQPRWSGWMKLTLAIAAMGAGAAVALAVSATWRETDSSSSDSDSDPVTSSIVGGVVTFGAMMALVGATSTDRDTPAGRAAAARWLGLRDLLSTDPIFAEQPPAGVAIWDRHLAYGASLGVAHGAVRALPLGAESDTEAWSSVGGRWRLVRVRYPTGIPPGFGRHPLRVALVGLLQLAVFGYVLSQLSGLPDAIGDAVRELSDDEPAWLDRVAQAVTITLAVIAGAVVLRAATMVVVGVADLVGGRRTIEGRVLRHRVRGDDDSKQWRVAVDDGSAETVRAWRLFRTVDTPQGSVVRAQVTRLLAHVKELTPVRPAVAVDSPGDLEALDDLDRGDERADLHQQVAAYTAAQGGAATGPPPPLPTHPVLSQATRRPLTPDPEATPYPLALGGASACYHGPDGARIQVAWASPLAIQAFSSLPRFLYRRIEGLGDEAYRSRFGGHIAARQGSRVAVVMTKLPSSPDSERDEIGEAVARAMLREATRSSPPSPSARGNAADATS